VDSGSGGISRTITTVDGEKRTFRNVGASRASIFNREGIGPFVDVKITTDESSFERGVSGMSEATITLDVAQEAARMLGMRMEADEKFDGETSWIPVRPEDE
jgi:hypothetical protein